MPANITSIKERKHPVNCVQTRSKKLAFPVKIIKPKAILNILMILRKKHHPHRRDRAAEVELSLGGGGQNK